MVFILDDLLWVLTDDQLKAALHYADSLSGLLKRATEETQKVKGARKLQSISEVHNVTKEKGSGKKKKNPRQIKSYLVPVFLQKYSRAMM